MTRLEFNTELKGRLVNLPQEDIDRTLQYYNEIISDRMEDGMTEDESIEALGSMDDIVKNVMLDMPFQTIIKARIKEKKKNMSNNTLWIILAIIGFPIWLPLFLAGISVLISVYVSVWAVIVSLCAVVFSFGIAFLATLIGGIVMSFTAGPAVGLCVMGIAFMCAGIVLFTVKPVSVIIKELVKLTAKFFRWIKSLFIAKKGA